VLTEAGTRTLAWDHPPSEPTRTSTPEAQPLIERLKQLYPQLSEASDAISGEAVVGSQDRMDDRGPDVRQLVGKMAALMSAFSPALELRAGEIEASGKNSELTDKLLKGADVMRDSGYLYLAWARHYVALSEGNPEAAEEADEAEFSV
jgi:hypothetical protein